MNRNPSMHPQPPRNLTLNPNRSTKKTPPAPGRLPGQRREQASRWVRTYNPLQPPRLTYRDVLGFLFCAGLMLAAASKEFNGVFADLALLGDQNGPFTHTITEGWLVTLFGGVMYVLFGIRSMRPLLRAGLLFLVVALSGWLGLVAVEQRHLNGVSFLLLMALTLMILNAMTRPSDHELLQAAREQNEKTEDERDEARRERDEALAKLARLEEPHD
ncbi:hypothetical protein [Deinococcus hohokamensis]|uniref:Uncharacterized protein n=1 Tax=Deinococcus hohokamensis TaxID=309883 RepID=A0ABV9I4E6_9DEIO